MATSGRNVKRNVFLAAIGIALVGAGVTALALRRGPPSLEGKKEKLSYALGLDLGNAARKQGIDLDADLAAKGLRDALSGGRTLLSVEQAQAAVLELQGELKTKRIAAERELAERNRKEGEAFLAENAKREGVTTLPSGLQYRVLKAGEGPAPTDADVVECSYRTSKVDGTELDRSERRAQLPVKGLLPGWREALKLMPVGSRWQLVVPAQLAFGSSTPKNAPAVGPNATLVYDVELLASRPAPAGAGPRRAAGRPAPLHAR